MKALHSCGLILILLGLSSPLLKARADSQLEQLRAQNAQLKARIESLELACPAAAASTAPANTATAAPSTAPPATLAPAAPNAVAAPAAPASPPQAPEGYQLVKIDPAASAADEENCSRGLFKNTKDAPWKHENTWVAVYKQMKPSEVEALLGTTHTSIRQGERTIWEYGKCGAKSAAQAYVVFERDQLLYWQQPDF